MSVITPPGPHTACPSADGKQAFPSWQRRPELWAWAMVLALLGALLGLAGPAVADPLPLPRAQQALVDSAIDRGVQYLKTVQARDNTWANPKGKHAVGYAALMGLTLLECGLAATDSAVQRLAGYVRGHSAPLETTYELSLAILLFDRLGDPKDEELIQTLALRLMAGQTQTGGWGYKCPRFSQQTKQEILTVLRQLDPQPAGGGPAAGRPGEAAKPDLVAPQPAPGQPRGAAQPRLPVIPKGVAGRPAEARKPEGPAGEQPPVRIPARLKSLVVFQDLAAPPAKAGSRRGEGGPLNGVTDNSNTQFATLAMWVAQRHNVPLTRTLTLIARRFETSQSLDGSWGYEYKYGGGEEERPSMDCVGLIGLAVGHGLARQPGAKGPADKPVADPRVVNGLVALSRQVGQPAGVALPPGPLDLYFLWSLERVAMLYNLPTIGDKDWYRWGVEMLLANQASSGSWQNGDYIGHHPTIDTCLALLFLKRANFVSDLTQRLPFKPGELALSVARRAGETRSAPESPGKAFGPGAKKPR